MAEAPVSTVTRLGELLIQEANFFSEVRSQVGGLQIELQRMRCFLKDAETKQEQDERVHNSWVTEIRDVCHEAEDVIDARIHLPKSKTRTREKRIKRFSCIVKEGMDIHRLGNQIENVNRKIRRNSESRVGYGISRIKDELFE
uniref:Disease resistance N-terminal domain-containing protein n=1 Tax=Nelumbo nucifera TaxID=4432 RepID=A0A822XXG7_NELNU|nr:TPA_asm: hypothetical protein HUJ06_025877 [Nelumbo nucifera]